ncbi:MAG: hypothetical protein HY293_13750 [Planctomycetes bacterium]|nr:hypothetical protein [Planctomycetota bacterium]
MRRTFLLLLLLAGCSSPGLRDDRARFLTEIPELRRISDTQFRIRSSGEILLEVPGRRSFALFPGLEFLEGEEKSSSDRDARGALADRRRPEPWKVTVPLMAYEVDGVLIALMWKDGAKPFFEAGEKNLMGLAPADKEFEAILVVEPGATIHDAVPRWTKAFGLPEPEPWPRTLEEELALCKAGFASVGAGRGKHRHAVGKDWPPDWTPGFGVLLHLLGEKVDWFDYSDLLSTVNCHILKWEAPFYAEEPGTLKKLVERMKVITDMRKRDDGEWGFHPMNADQRKLGPAGESVLGTSAHNALSVAKAARMTGDAELKAIALDVLGRLRRHQVPRGAQSWECPLYEPDLLAAAFAIGAYVEAYKLSGDAAWLTDAARWARAGLPFLYLWSLPGRKGMRYASIPVFGSTQFTHPWFGVPVQWNGLVYAYYLRKLAPLEKSFDWLRVADGITASAVHQQYSDGPSKGCYPDALYDQCSRRAPPDINPEDLLVNILSSIGKDPDPDLTLVPTSLRR